MYSTYFLFAALLSSVPVFSQKLDIIQPRFNTTWAVGNPAVIKWNATFNPDGPIFIKFILLQGNDTAQTADPVAVLGQNVSVVSGHWLWNIDPNLSIANDYYIQISSSENSVYSEPFNIVTADDNSASNVQPVEKPSSNAGVSENSTPAADTVESVTNSAMVASFSENDTSSTTSTSKPTTTVKSSDGTAKKPVMALAVVALVASLLF